MNLLDWLDPWEPSPTVVIAVLAAAILFHLFDLRTRVHLVKSDARPADWRLAAVDSGFDDERARRADRLAPLDAAFRSRTVA
jgi:hypothetical protein